MAKSLVPALQELESMFDHIYHGYMKPIFDKHLASYSKHSYNSGNNIQWPMKPIINLAAAGKRTAKVWYVPDTWENQTTTVVAKMAGRTATKMGELNVSTDLLTEDDETIMKHLAGGAFMHLNSIVAFTQDRWFMDQAYNSKTGYWYKWKSSPSQYGIELTEVDAGQYTTKLVFQGDVTSDLEKHIKAYTVLDSKAFDTHRDKPAANTKTSSNGLKKWQCPYCQIPIRASKVLYMVCQCGKQIEYADKDKTLFYKEHMHFFEGQLGTLVPDPTRGNRGASSTDCKLCEQKYAYTEYNGRKYVDGPHYEHDPYTINDTYNGPYYVRRKL